MKIADDQEVQFPAKDRPVTVSDAVDALLSEMSSSERSAIASMPRDELIRLHFGFGTTIRNRFGLWTGNSQLLVAACGEFCDPDDASMRIIEALWLRLQQLSFPKNPSCPVRKFDPAGN